MVVGVELEVQELDLKSNFAEEILDSREFYCWDGNAG